MSESTIAILSAEIDKQDALIAKLYSRLDYSEKRRKEHFAELLRVKKERQITARRLGKKRRIIRQVVRELQ